jgi:hypothetical protein
VRPGKWDAHDGHGEQDRRDEVAERQPPSGENKPHDVADHPQRAGAEVFAAEIPLYGNATIFGKKYLKVAPCDEITS